ncbi:hypothetical protein I5907_13880 [Panacibacter sp. DH6]|uniref:Uncharacterized protein n=1 Tax=Panacibacter microcysteis TaxID=2793269 RepID=A0A931E6Z3_9BACT|nr:hypothetical protein [Panacibacter microcysteis]MBG9377327.1 hypothetical protein [Panacibacter microcysteis]
MRTVFTVFAITACSFLFSCNKETNTATLGIDVQATFKEDHVQVLLDSKEIINDTLTSSPVITVCENGRFATNINTGNHVLKVIINRTAETQYAFKMTSDHYIGIKHSAGEIFFEGSDKPFIYR